jgi:hypothetical protein
LNRNADYRYPDLPQEKALVSPIPSAADLTNRAILWLETVPPERPLHLFVDYFDPHHPYEPPPGFDSFSEAASNRGQETHGEGRTVRGTGPRCAIDRYDRAIIIAVADHGELFGEHQQTRHGRFLYGELVRVPLLVHFRKGASGGQVVDSPVSVVDLLPLIAEEVRLPLPPGVEGTPVGKRRLVLMEVFRDATSIRLNPDLDRDLVAAVRWPWKLIVSDSGVRELYRIDTARRRPTTFLVRRRETLFSTSWKRHAQPSRPPASVQSPIP